MTTIVSSFGSSQANAYCSPTQAHSIVSGEVIDADAWTSASTAAREAAVLSATREIDAVPWLGRPSRRIDQGQSLDFPRTSVGLPRRILALNVDDALDAENDALARACALHALWLLANSDSDDHDQRAAAGVARYSYRLGALSEAFAYRGAPGAVGSFSRLAPAAQTIMSDFPRAKRISRA